MFGDDIEHAKNVTQAVAETAIASVMGNLTMLIDETLPKLDAFVDRTISKLTKAVGSAVDAALDRLDGVSLSTKKPKPVAK